MITPSSTASKILYPQHQQASMSSAVGISKETSTIPEGDEGEALHPCVSCIRNVCGCEQDLQSEKLGYDYLAAEKYQTAKDEGKLANSKLEPPPLPRIRRRGEFYLDSFNELPNACTFGTNEEVSDHKNFCQAETCFLF